MLSTDFRTVDGRGTDFSDPTNSHDRGRKVKRLTPPPPPLRPDSLHLSLQLFYNAIKELFHVHLLLGEEGNRLSHVSPPPLSLLSAWRRWGGVGESESQERREDGFSRRKLLAEVLPSSRLEEQRWEVWRGGLHQVWMMMARAHLAVNKGVWRNEEQSKAEKVTHRRYSTMNLRMVTHLCYQHQLDVLQQKKRVKWSQSLPGQLLQRAKLWE